MSDAALTPRVRAIVACDEALLSEVEEEVFTLEGARLGFGAEAFPTVRQVVIYLQLSYPRGGRFDGEVKLVPAEEDRTIRIARFTVDFDGVPSARAREVDLGPCTFPEPGEYSIQVWFSSPTAFVLKNETPFHVWQLEG